MPTASETQRVQCTGCEARFKIKAKYIGKKIECPKCQMAFRAKAVPKKKKRPKSSKETSEASSETRSKKPLKSSSKSQKTPAEPKPALEAAAPLSKPKRKKDPNKTPDTPPGMRRCNLCHEFIPKPDYAAHRKSHKGTRKDGQLNQYPTLPPEKQYKGDLSKVPQKYIHETCGNKTRMPEEIIRTYLVNPYFYGYSSYCSGCQRHVPNEELNWESTGESLMHYTRKLQATLPNATKYRNQFLKTWIITSLIIGLLIALLVGGMTYLISGLATALTIFFAVGLVAVMGTAFALVTKRGGI